MKRPSLNHCFRLVWSEAQGAWVPVPETARGHGKTGRCALGLLATALLAPAFALASPSGGVVTSGAATINQSGAVTNVNQSTQKAAINWQGFSVGSGETVNFNQPNASAVTLNRVVGNETSVIDGALNATGQVFIVNSNGVLFGKGSSVDVGGLVASTRSISDADFNAGHYVFQGNGSGSVTNLGTLTAKDGGYIALLGNSVSNQGVISATKGTVALAAGNKITLNFNGDSLLNVTLDEGALDALVENKQAIYADGGTVLLTAKAADELLGAQVNNSGLIRARTLDDLKGSITLYAYGGTTTVDGTLDASAPIAGSGGAIETSGETVNVADTASISTLASAGKSGTWLIDPTDFTIAASGGDMTGKLLSALLASGSITISSSAGASGTSGNVNVNDAISWNTPSTLTLTAANNININSPITANYSAWSAASPTVKAGLTLNAGYDIDINNAVSLTNAALVMTYGDDYNIRTKASYSGAVLNASGLPVANTDTSGGVYGSITFNGGLNSGDALTINGNPYTLIYSLNQLDMLDGYSANTDSGYAWNPVTGYYALANNLDAGGTTYHSSIIIEFDGTLAGLGHKISNLTIDDDASLAPWGGGIGLIGYTGFFQTVPLVTIRDIGIENVNITASGGAYFDYGALIGGAYGPSLYVKNAYSTGTISVTGESVGGLIGEITPFSSTSPSYVINAYSNVNVSAGGAAGGLIGAAGGVIGGSVAPVYVEDSHATGSVTGTTQYGGGGANLGGLIGEMLAGTVDDSYATGALTGHSIYVGSTLYDSVNIGGLIGQLGASTAAQTNSVTNSYATGNVYGGYFVGGLIGLSGVAYGFNSYFSTISNVYATGNVVATESDLTGNTDVGGLIGAATFTNIDHAYAAGNVSATLSEGYSQTNAQGIGGLVGLSSGTISYSYATGNVSGASGGGKFSYGIGGLVGDNATALTQSGGTSLITDSWSTGSVSGTRSVGGLVGSAGDISNSWTSGTVSGSSQVGGLAGNAFDNTITNSYWNTTTSGQSQASGNGATVPGASGLSGTQIGDVSYYLNGTINQVVADRTAADAAAAAAAATAQTAANAATAAAAQAALNAAGQPGSSAAAQAAANAQSAAAAAAAAAALAAQTAAQGSSLAAIQAATAAAQTAATNAANAAAAAQSALSGATTAVSNAEAAAAAAAAAQAAAAAAAAQAAAEAAAKAAAAAAAKERAFEQGAVATADAQVASPLGAPKPPETAGPSPRTPAQALDQNIVFTASKYSADIRSIEVNGQAFQLDDDEKKKKQQQQSQPQPQPQPAK